MRVGVECSLYPTWPALHRTMPASRNLYEHATGPTCLKLKPEKVQKANQRLISLMTVVVRSNKIMQLKMWHILRVQHAMTKDFISGLGRWPILETRYSVHQKINGKFSVIILIV